MLQSDPVLTLANGWQLVQIWPLVLSIPKSKDKHYRAEITFRDEPSVVRAVLDNPRVVDIDGNVVDTVFVLIDQQNIPAVTRDAILKVEILHELAQEEYEAVASEIKKVMAKKRRASVAPPPP